ncbi:hypothetical protein COW64_24470, partial [bacterium (Candidatus Blackallbacteria) CG18_big_fil_WC_8_21_14_2_50_49_26]
KILVPGLELKVFAGSGKAGYKDGPALEAEFRSFGGMAQDEQGNLYISDSEDFRIRKIDSKGNVSTLAGTGKQVAHGKTGSFLETEFYSPGRIVFKAPHSLLVQSEGFGSRLFLLNLITQQSQLFMKNTESNTSPPYQSNFQETSHDLPLAFGGSVYSMTVHNNAIYLGLDSEIWTLTDTNGLYKFERYAGNAAVNPVGGSIDDARRNFKDGPPDDSKFNRPASMVFDKTGNMYVADALNHRIRKVEAGSRNVSTLTGYGIPDPRTTIDQNFIGGFKDGLLREALFDSPNSLILTEDQTLIIFDGRNKSIRIIIQDHVYSFIHNCFCSCFLKSNSAIYITDGQNNQIYTLDLSQLEKLKPQILNQEKPLP